MSDMPRLSALPQFHTTQLLQPLLVSVTLCSASLKRTISGVSMYNRSTLSPFGNNVSASSCTCSAPSSALSWNVFFLWFSILEWVEFVGYCCFVLIFVLEWKIKLITFFFSKHKSIFNWTIWNKTNSLQIENSTVVNVVDVVIRVQSKVNRKFALFVVVLRCQLQLEWVVCQNKRVSELNKGVVPCGWC